MEEPSPLRLTLFGALRSAGIGLLIGGLEALTLPLSVRLPLGPGGFALLGLVAILGFGLFGGVVGAVVGLPLHLVLKRVVISRGLAVQLALTTLVLVGVFFGSMAMEESAAGGRGWVIGGLVGFTLFLPMVVFLFASRLFRMMEHGQPSQVPFVPVAGGVALVALGAGVGLAASRDTDGGTALDSDPRVVVIAVDSLRADLGGARAPNLARLAGEGARFTGAVTPAPGTAPSVASILAGRPPLRHRVLEDGDALGRYRALLPAVFQEAGYATAGFVSSPPLSHRSGFDFGFHLYDDDNSPLLPGLRRLRLFSWSGQPAVRPDADTVDRFTAWLDEHDHVPFFALVHLHGPREPFVPHGLPGFEANGIPGAPLVDHAARLEERSFSDSDARTLRRLYQEEVEAVDVQIGRVLQAITDAGLEDRTVVVVVGTGGELLGEHAGAFTHEGLYDPTVRTAMVVRIPGMEAEDVEAQVRVHDLYPTLLEHAEIEPPESSEGISLIGYLEGKRSLSLWTVLTGRDLSGHQTLGYRDDGLKYLVDVESGAERLFDLDDDPGEETNAVSTLPDTVEAARGRLASERVLLGELRR